MEDAVPKRGAREGVKCGEGRFGIGGAIERHDDTAAGGIGKTDIRNRAEGEEGITDLRERKADGRSTIGYEEMGSGAALAGLRKSHHLCMYLL